MIRNRAVSELVLDTTKEGKQSWSSHELLLVVRWLALDVCRTQMSVPSRLPGAFTKCAENVHEHVLLSV